MRTLKISFFLFAVCLSGLVLGCSVPKIVQAQNGDPVLVGAGDVSSCRQQRDDATAKLLDGIEGTVFTLGDNAYPDGTLDEFKECYEPTWGRHKARTRPSPGNHDYHSTGAPGYYTYFGEAASPLDTNCTDNCKGYYAYNLGDWHIIVLNSEIEISEDSAQVQWLRSDLAANQSNCTLAYWHNPRFSSGGSHGSNPKTAPFWKALYEYGADLVLNGHDHDYERFAPQNPDGEADPQRGIREFVVGTGGANVHSFGTIQPNSEVRNSDTWGVLRLTLHPTRYDWQFIPVAGQTFTDAGSAGCVGIGTEPTRMPTPPATPVDTPVPTPITTPNAPGGGNQDQRIFLPGISH